MKFRTLVALAAAAAAAAVAWKMLKDTDGSEADSTVDRPEDETDSPEEDGTVDAPADGSDTAAAPQEAEPDGERDEKESTDPAPIADEKDLTGDWDSIGCNNN